MSWPKGRKNPAAAERMRQYHAKRQPQGGEEKPNKPSLSLGFLSPDERRVYNRMRNKGVSRDDAIRVLTGAPR